MSRTNENIEDDNLNVGLEVRLGIDREEVSRQVEEYETNYLTPEMDSESFEVLLYMIYDDQTKEGVTGDPPIIRLSRYYGGYYGGIPVSSKAIIENIVPFFVVNKWFKVFCVEEKENKRTKKDYLIVFRQVEKLQVEKWLRHWHSYYKPGWKYEITHLEEVTV